MHKKRQSSGFILLEAAILIAIIGICSATAIAIYSSMQKYMFVNDIKTKQESIVKILSAYLLEYGRLPCACADSSGTETVGHYIGSVPYNTLNIPEQMTKDTKGNPLIYVVLEACTTSTALSSARSMQIAQDSSMFCDIETSDIRIMKNGSVINQDTIVCVVLLPKHEFHDSQRIDKNFEDKNIIKWVSKRMFLTLYCNITC